MALIYRIFIFQAPLVKHNRRKLQKSSSGAPLLLLLLPAAAFQIPVPEQTIERCYRKETIRSQAGELHLISGCFQLLKQNVCLFLGQQGISPFPLPLAKAGHSNSMFCTPDFDGLAALLHRDWDKTCNRPVCTRQRSRRTRKKDRKKIIFDFSGFNFSLCGCI